MLTFPESKRIYDYLTAESYVRINQIQYNPDKKSPHKKFSPVRSLIFKVPKSYCF